jgi:hypothetical protein
MIQGKRIEWPKGGVDRQDPEYKEEEIKGDKGFMNAIINDDYVKTLKEKQHEKIYVEKNDDRLLFTNSCWEI